MKDSNDSTLEEALVMAAEEARKESQIAREDREKRFQTALARVERELNILDQARERRYAATRPIHQRTKEKILLDTQKLIEKHERERRDLKVRQLVRRETQAAIDYQVELKRVEIAVVQEEKQRAEIAQRMEQIMAEEEAQRERIKQREIKRKELEKAAHRATIEALRRNEERANQRERQMIEAEKQLEALVALPHVSHEENMRAVANVRRSLYEAVEALTSPVKDTPKDDSIPSLPSLEWETPWDSQEARDVGDSAQWLSEQLTKVRTIAQTLNLTEQDLRDMGFEPLEEASTFPAIFSVAVPIDPSVVISDPALKLNISDEEAEEIVAAFGGGTNPQ